jgi:hypothetical protein
LSPDLVISHFLFTCPGTWNSIELFSSPQPCFPGWWPTPVNTWKLCITFPQGCDVLRLGLTFAQCF